LFVELYDQNKKLITKAQLPIFNGESSGSLNPGEHVNEGVYYIRAYTNWMTNFSEDFHYIQPIAIFNPESKLKLTKKTDLPWTASIRPEGGTFVEGLKTQFAVRLQSSGDLPSSWKGYVSSTDQPDTKIVNFASLDPNVATFGLTAQQGKTYQLTVEDNKGQKQTIALPTATPKGVQLQVSTDAKGIHYTLSSKNITGGLNQYSIVGTVNNHLAYKAVIRNGNEQASSTIPLSISNGTNVVMQLSIFDEKENIVAQRLVFIQPEKNNFDTPTIKNFHLDFKPRSVNSIDLEPKTDIVNYTVSIKDQTDNDPYFTTQSNLLSSLWLTSDFPSSIYRPDQYFTANASATALDALMMSEKWKRFDWNPLLQGIRPDNQKKPPYYLSYQGRATLNGSPVRNKDLSIMMKTENTNSDMLDVETDENGTFLLSGLFFTSPAQVTYFLNSTGAEKVNSMNLIIYFKSLLESAALHKDFPETSYYLAEATAKTEIPVAQKRAINQQQFHKTISKNETLIQEVQLKAKKKDLKQQLNDQLSSGMFKNNFNETVFDLVNENPEAQSSPNILQWLQGRAAGLTMQSQGGMMTPMIRNSPAKVYVDEVPSDASMLNSLSVADIAMVKVIKGSGLLGDALAVYTRRGNMPSEAASANKMSDLASTSKVILKGYDLPKPYFNPDYTQSAYQSISTDTRPVLYWNTDFNTNETESIDFYSNDDAKSMKITIIGFTSDGKPLYYEQTKTQ